MGQFYDLFEWETPAQQTWFKYIQFVAVPHGNLKREFMKRFPSEPWPSDVPIHFYEIRIPDANVTSSDEQRAQATFRHRNESPHVLHLVKKHNRWWISGYSIERAGNLETLQTMASDTGQSLDTLLAAAGRERQGVFDLTRRLKSGDIKTVQQFWEAAEATFGAP